MVGFEPPNPNGHGTTVLARLSYGARLRDLAAAREGRKQTTVTLPQASAEAGEPVTFQVRAMSMKEMRRSGLMPDPLAERIRAFQDELTYYAVERMGGKNEGADADLERKAMLAYFKDAGAQEFEDVQDATRDATVICCCVEPRVLLDDSLVIDLDHEVALEWISEADRAHLQAEIARLTGDLAMRDLKSDLSRERDQAGAVAAASPPGDGLWDAAEHSAGIDGVSGDAL